MRQNIIYLLFSGVIIALLAGSIGQMFQRKQDLNPIEVLSSIAENNNIKFNNTYLAQKIPKKHNFTNNTHLYDYVQKVQQGEVIQKIVQSIRMPFLYNVVHPILDEVKTVIRFNIPLTKGDYNIIPNFINFHQKAKQVLKNTNNRRDAIPQIIDISKKDQLIYHEYNTLSFFNDKNHQTSVHDYQITIYKFGIISPIRQIGNILSFDIIVSTEPGYFKSHQIPEQTFQNIVLYDIVNSHK